MQSLLCCSKRMEQAYTAHTALSQTTLMMDSFPAAGRVKRQKMVANQSRASSPYLVFSCNSIPSCWGRWQAEAATDRSDRQCKLFNKTGSITFKTNSAESQSAPFPVRQSPTPSRLHRECGASQGGHRVNKRQLDTNFYPPTTIHRHSSPRGTARV